MLIDLPGDVDDTKYEHREECDENAQVAVFFLEETDCTLANVPVDQIHLLLAALSVPRRVGKLFIVLVFFVRVGHDGGRVQLDLADLKHETVVNTPNVKLIATRQRQTQRAVVRLTQRTLSPPQRMAKIAHPKMM